MTKLLLMIAMSGCVGQVFGSEKNEIYQFTAYLRNNEPLVSCDEEYIDRFNNMCNTQYRYDVPFLRVYFDSNSANKLPCWKMQATRDPENPDEVKKRHAQQMQLKEKLRNSITHIPLNCFLRNGKFKEAWDTLLVFSISDENQEKQLLQIELEPKFVNDNPQVLLERFKTNQLSQNSESKGLEKEMKAEKETIKKVEGQKKLNKDYWRITIPITVMGIIVILGPIIASYVLYKKYHATAG